MRVAVDIAAPTAAHQRRRQIFAIVLLGQFVIVSSTAALNVALAAVQVDLGASAAQIQWIALVPQLAFAAVLVTSGRLGDMFGHRRLFLAGLAGLFGGAVLGATAQSPALLIVARLIMGVSGGLASPPALAFIQTLFVPAERAKAYSLLGMVGAGSYLAGQLIAGALIEIDLFELGWRHAFSINLIVGAAALALGAALIPRDMPGARQRLDLNGAALSATCAILLLYPLIRGASAGWDTISIAMVCVAPLAGAAFVLHERRLTRALADPLVDLRLFRLPKFGRGLGAIIALNTMSYAPFYLIVLTLQFGYHFTPLSTAMATAASPVGAVWGARLSARRAHLPVSADFRLGAAMMAGGAATAMIVMRLSGLALDALYLIVPMFVIGASTGLIGATATRLTMTNVPPEQAGSASSVLQTAQQFMMAVVIAAGGAMFFALVRGEGPQGFFPAMAITMTTFLSAAAIIGVVASTAGRGR